MMLWMDQNNSAEIIVAQMGAAKSGVSVVTFSEKDSCDAFHETLKASNAKGLYFSPSTSNADKSTRLTYLQKLMPELDSYYPGDELKLSNYPNLKNIVQTGHKNIRGTLKFKDSLVFANASMSPFSLPTNESSW